MILSTIVVHPDYRRRGYARMLLEHIETLADKENVKLGVSASQMGKLLMEECGFKKLDEVEVPSYRHHEKPIKLWLGSREPQKPLGAWQTIRNKFPFSTRHSVCFDDSANMAVTDDDEYLTTARTDADEFAAAKTAATENYGKMARNRARKVYLRGRFSGSRRTELPRHKSLSEKPS